MSQWQRTPTFGQVLDKTREVTKRQMKCAAVGVVQAYDPLTQTADVQPQVDDWVQQEDGTFVALPLPVVPHVPVAFPGGGGMRVTFPLKQGDTGQLVFCDLSIDEWQSAGGHVTPGDRRRHHIADAVFYPGAHPDSASWAQASATNTTIGSDSLPFDFTIMATAYRAAEDTYFGALEAVLGFNNTLVAAMITQPTMATYLGGLGGAVATAIAGLAAAITAYTTAATTFHGAASTYLTQAIKVN